MDAEHPADPGELRHADDGSVSYGLSEDAWIEAPRSGEEPADEGDLLVADVHGRQWRLRRRASRRPVPFPFSLALLGALLVAVVVVAWLLGGPPV